MLKILGILCIILSFLGCKAGVPKVTGLRQPPSNQHYNITSSTKQNLTAVGSGGNTVVMVSGLKIKFSVGYNQLGPKVDSLNTRIRSSSSGVLNER